MIYGPPGQPWLGLINQPTSPKVHHAMANSPCYAPPTHFPPNLIFPAASKWRPKAHNKKYFMHSGSLPTPNKIKKSERVSGDHKV